MNPMELADFRRLLSELKSSIFEIDNLPASEGLQGDTADMVQQQQGNSLKARVAARHSVHLKQIDAALGRIRQGSFGECYVCEEPIEKQRLKAHPTTMHCISCKESEEK